MSIRLLAALIWCGHSFVWTVFSLNAKAWQSADADPEISDFPETPYLLSRSNTAIGFSGGGSRAYVAALGQISALNKLGLLSKIKYIGGISGGSWASIVVTYAQNVRDVERFLCPIVPPEDINPKILEKIDPDCVRRFAADDLIEIALGLLKERAAYSVADAWAGALQIMYLDPVGIPKGERFSWNKETVEDIKARNQELRPSRFLLPGNSSWPFPLIGTTLVGPLSNAPYGSTNHNYTRMDITPLYIGQLKSTNVVYRYLFNLLKRVVRVGGAIEPFAFARTGSAPKFGLPKGTQCGELRTIPAPVNIMDLQFAVGVSSYAPGAFAESIPLGISDSFGLHMSYWSPTNPIKPTNYDMLFGDGGSIENIPLISFLQRKVENIILFMNYEDPLQPIEKWNVTENSRKYGQISDSVPAYFGIFIEKDSSILNRAYDYSKNQVFAEKDYSRVVLALQAAQHEGSGIIATLNLTTVKNEYWGIPEGFTPQISFVYLGRLRMWEEKLIPDMKKLVIPPGTSLGDDIKTGPFEGFPHYTTLGGGINTERSNLLGDMTGWSVLQNADLFQSLCV